MSGARYRHVIDIDRPVSVQDDVTGDITISWSRCYYSVPASVLTGPGREHVVSGAELPDVDARIATRWFDGLEPTMRIVFESVIYEIISIDTDATGRGEYRIGCKRGVSHDGR